MLCEIMLISGPGLDTLYRIKTGSSKVIELKEKELGIVIPRDKLTLSGMMNYMYGKDWTWIKVVFAVFY